MGEAYPALFETAFIDGTSVEQDGYTYEMYRQDIGSLPIKTGKIVANDPMCLFETEPFTEHFPTGEFPVQLAIAKIAPKQAVGEQENDLGPDERVAFARILFSNKPAVSWKMAIWAHTDASELEEGEFYGYGVDAGTGSFMDVDACRLLEKASEQNDSFMDSLNQEMEQTYQHTRSWLMKDIGNGYKIAMFSTGWGDGSYGSYIGFDADGNIVSLVTDFYIVDWMKSAEEER